MLTMLLLLNLLCMLFSMLLIHVFVDVVVSFVVVEALIVDLNTMQIPVDDLPAVDVLDRFDVDFPVVLLFFCLMLLSWMSSIHSSHLMLSR